MFQVHLFLPGSSAALRVVGEFPVFDPSHVVRVVLVPVDLNPFTPRILPCTRDHLTKDLQGFLGFSFEANHVGNS